MVGLENPLHIALVLVVILMVFGAKRLPEMGRSLGEGLRGFTKSLHGDLGAQPTPVREADDEPLGGAGPHRERHRSMSAD